MAIYSDSQVSLKAICSPEIEPRMVPLGLDRTKYSKQSDLSMGIRLQRISEL